MMVFNDKILSSKIFIKKEDIKVVWRINFSTLYAYVLNFIIVLYIIIEALCGLSKAKKGCLFIGLLQAQEGVEK